MMKQIFLLLVFISTVFLTSHAQNTFTVSGIITDKSSGESLAGVSLNLLHTPIGSMTNLNGHYSFQITSNEKDTLRFMYIGYKTQKIAIHNRHQINVQLEKAPTPPMPVVVTCCCAATQDKKDSVITPKNPDHPKGILF